MMPFRLDIRVSHENTKARNPDGLFRDFVLSSPIPSAEAQALPLVASGLHLLAPVAVLEVPARGRRDPGLERVARRPPELAADPGRVDRVAPIVSGPVRHERLQAAVGRPFQ